MVLPTLNIPAHKPSLNWCIKIILLLAIETLPIIIARKYSCTVNPCPVASGRTCQYSVCSNTLIAASSTLSHHTSYRSNPAQVHLPPYIVAVRERWPALTVIKSACTVAIADCIVSPIAGWTALIILRHLSLNTLTTRWHTWYSSVTLSTPVTIVTTRNRR